MQRSILPNDDLGTLIFLQIIGNIKKNYDLLKVIFLKKLRVSLNENSCFTVFRVEKKQHNNSEQCSLIKQ